MSFRGEGSSLNLLCGSISKCEYSRESCQGLWKGMEPDGAQTEVRDRACPDWMFLVVLQLRHASGNVEPRGIPGGLCSYFMFRQWTPRAKVFSGPKVASVFLRLTVFLLQAGLGLLYSPHPEITKWRTEKGDLCRLSLGPISSVLLATAVISFFSFHSSSAWSVFCLDLSLFIPQENSLQGFGYFLWSFSTLLEI